MVQVTKPGARAVPKAKFVIINLPFKQVAVKKLMVKKKPIMAIYAEETGGDRMTSATFRDGKKYRYQPIGSSLGDRTGVGRRTPDLSNPAFDVRGPRSDA